MQMKPETLSIIKQQAKRLQALETSLYHEKFKGIDIDAIETAEDFARLPFTEKKDLRDVYPLGLAAVPEEQIVRIHSSSGTTGTPIIIPYTQKDVDDWAILFERCYRIAGVTMNDRVQITPGYGLWTAGIGFQLGVERLGAMAVPMGPGNTEKQLRFLEDMKSTVLCATSSYALLLAEEIAKRGIRDKVYLKKGIIGSERWGEKMRRRIASELGIELYDIYGLTEIYGPGIAVSCSHDCGMHYFDDYLYFEIIDPVTGENLPDGELGELVITTLQKEGAPLIRYRTHDLTRILPDPCPCGRSLPRIDIILGRTDDMIKVKGVNMFPAQIEEVLKAVDGISSEYLVEVNHVEGRDHMIVKFEVDDEAKAPVLEKAVRHQFKQRIGMTPDTLAVPMGTLPRSEKKSKRVVDNR
ncbi:MAG: phenylacetate--CoA ligase [Selenomonadales bacterium]|nr:phenylacetate--CoA ligase [Selenomonadales bacterium]